MLAFFMYVSLKLKIGLLYMTNDYPETTLRDTSTIDQ